MNTVEILKAARELLVTKGWTQGVYARSAAGSDVDPLIGDRQEAACYCGWGACLKASGDWRVGLIDPAEALTVAAGTFFPHFNDAPGRTVEEVLAVFDKAIATEEAKCAPAA